MVSGYSVRDGELQEDGLFQGEFYLIQADKDSELTGQDDYPEGPKCGSSTTIVS